MTYHDASLYSVDVDPPLSVAWDGGPAMGTYWRLLDLDRNDPRVRINAGFDASLRAGGAEIRRFLQSQEELDVTVRTRPPDLVRASADRDPTWRRIPLGEVLRYVDDAATYVVTGGEL